MDINLNIENDFGFIDGIDDFIDEIDAELTRRLVPIEAAHYNGPTFNIFCTPDKSAIAILTSRVQRLEYYGGFEYIAKEHRRTLGSYTFYLANTVYQEGDNRVNEMLDIPSYEN